MEFLSDIFLVSGAFAAAFYCMVLSRRLRKFTDLEDGIGGAVAQLALKADDLDRALRAAQVTATQSVSRLEDVSARAETSARHLELLVASLHSLPSAEASVVPDINPFRARRASAAGKPQ